MKKYILISDEFNNLTKMSLEELIDEIKKEIPKELPESESEIKSLYLADE